MGPWDALPSQLGASARPRPLVQSSHQASLAPTDSLAALPLTLRPRTGAPVQGSNPSHTQPPKIWGSSGGSPHSRGNPPLTGLDCPDQRRHLHCLSFDDWLPPKEGQQVVGPRPPPLTEDYSPLTTGCVCDVSSRLPRAPFARLLSGAASSSANRTQCRRRAASVLACETLGYPPPVEDASSTDQNTEGNRRWSW